MSSENKNSRLPPPAFPPGVRGKVQRSSISRVVPTVGDGDAFISPDDPIPPRDDKIAFISPDDPLPPRADDVDRDKVASALIEPEDAMPPRGSGGEGEGEGVVTGMGFDAHMEPEELVTGGDPYVIEVVDAVRKLADALRRRGEAGLRASPDMSRLESTLRSYCVGYLAGRRAAEEAERAEISRRVQPKAEAPDF